MNDLRGNGAEDESFEPAQAPRTHDDFYAMPLFGNSDNRLRNIAHVRQSFAAQPILGQDTANRFESSCALGVVILLDHGSVDKKTLRKR